MGTVSGGGGSGGDASSVPSALDALIQRLVASALLSKEPFAYLDSVMVENIPEYRKAYRVSYQRSVNDFLLDSFRFYRMHREEDLVVAKQLAFYDAFWYVAQLAQGGQFTSRPMRDLSWRLQKPGPDDFDGVDDGGS